MASRIGPGDWVTFVDSDGQFGGGRVTSEQESLGGGVAIVWVDAVQPDGSMLQTPVPARALRPASPPGHAR